MEIKKYHEYNEELSRKSLLAGVIAIGVISGAAKIMLSNKPEQEIVNGVKFIEYETTTNSGQSIYFSISKDGVIANRWSVTTGSDDDEETTYYNTITISEKSTKVYYKRRFLDSYIHASESKISNNFLDISKMKIVKETSEYKVLKVDSFFGDEIDYVMVIKSSPTNGKGKFQINNYTYSYLNPSLGFFEKDAYFVFASGLGGGSFGGGGVTADY